MISEGWCGKILRIDVSKPKHVVQRLSKEMAKEYLGGRGFAIKILWDELSSGTHPLSPQNKLILATGPLTGLNIPSSGKMVIASKSPLTMGYGDGNIGTKASVQLRKAGYDAVVIEGRAKKPTVILIEDWEVSFIEAPHLWGKNTFEVEEELEEEHGDAGILVIGPAGENHVRYAVIISERGRSGGRPGMGAVMGSKNIKAIVIKGSGELPVLYPEKIKELGREAYQEILKKDNYNYWIRQGTMMTVDWSQENSDLPTMNFKEGVFDKADNINGDVMEEKYKVKRTGCPKCNMQCGNVCEIREGLFEGSLVEVDYENVGMLGSNLAIDSMDDVLALNLLADKQGVDTISLGNVLGFVTELHTREMIQEQELDEISLKWGNGEAMMRLAEKITTRDGIGNKLAEGVRLFSQLIGKGKEFAMQIKGLEISAYDCHAAPGMALAFATSPIGAHHKDAWFIALEVKMGRDLITREKVLKLIEMQRLRGGLFEAAVCCRLPWIELGFNLEWYPRFLEAATGIKVSMEDVFKISDRIYNLIRCFWIREYGGWSREMDVPPARWFDEPLEKGYLRGKRLSRKDYNTLLNWYYEERGWDENGMPRRSTLSKVGLSYVAGELESRGVTLKP